MARRRRRFFVDSLNAPAKGPAKRHRAAVRVVRRQPVVILKSSPRILPRPASRSLVRVAKRPARSQKAAGLDAFGPVHSIGGPIDVKRLSRALSCAERARRREVLFALDLRRKGKGGSRKPKSTEKC